MGVSSALFLVNATISTSTSVPNWLFVNLVLGSALQSVIVAPGCAQKTSALPILMKSFTQLPLWLCSGEIFLVHQGLDLEVAPSAKNDFLTHTTNGDMASKVPSYVYPKGI